MDKDIFAFAEQCADTLLDWVNMGILKPTVDTKKQLLTTFKQEVEKLFQELNEEEE